MKKDDTLTIPEVAKITGKSINTIYREIKKKKLKVITVTFQGKEVIRVKKQELERFCKDNDITWNINDMSDDKIGYINDMSDNKTGYTNDMSDIIKQTIDKTLTQLTKPIEEQALFIAGALTKENQFLKEKLETVLEENKQLQEQIKALPGPVESIQQVLMENAQNLNLLQQEKEKLLTQVEEYKPLRSQLEDTTRKLQEKEDALKEQEVKLLQEKAEAEARIKAEKEEANKQKEKLEEKIKQEAEEKSMAKAEAEEALKQLKELPTPVESIHQILLDNANNIKELTEERDKFQTVLKEHEATIKEKEKILKDIEELRKHELEDLKKQTEEEKARLKSEAEEREKQIAEAWKKELELAKKPWWKFW